MWTIITNCIHFSGLGLFPTMLNFLNNIYSIVILY